MAFVLNEGQGTLFRNDKKGVENRPDRRGELRLGGVLYEIAGWIKQGRSGDWMSLSVKVKEESVPTQRIGPAQPLGSDDGGVPF